MTEFKKGDRVTYTDARDQQQAGIVKSKNDKWVFVVFNCADNWHRFDDYTARPCNPAHLVHGWPGEDANIHQVLENAVDILRDMPDPEEPHATQFTIAKMLLLNVLALVYKGYPSSTPVKPTLTPYDGQYGDLPHYSPWIEIDPKNPPEHQVLATKLTLGRGYREIVVGYVDFSEEEDCPICESEHELLIGATHYRELGEVLPNQ